jgi:hypothetical protein
VRTRGLPRFVASFSGAALLFGILGASVLAPSGPAAASRPAAAPQVVRPDVQLSSKVTYHCKIYTTNPTSPLFTTTFPIILSGTVPEGVDPGHKISISDFQADVTITTPTLETEFAGLFSSVSGQITTVDASITTASPTVANFATTPWAFGPIIPKAGTAVQLKAPTPAYSGSPWTTTTPGTAVITPGDVKVLATLTNRATPPVTKPVHITCVPLKSVPVASVVIAKPSIPATTLRTATAGIAYAATVPVTGGTGPFTWSVAGGSVPPGLSLNASTGQLTGTPTAVGTYTFTAHVKDANGFTATGAVTVKVLSSGTVGYHLVASDGGLFSFGFGGHGYFGSMGGKPLNAPIVGMSLTPSARGYWEVASDGGIFSFGDAKFHGSMGGKPLNKPIVGIAGTPDGQGYWEVASDGGIFAFGNATFYGSMGGKPLNEPIIGITPTPTGTGYWEVASDGGLFSFGTAKFHGSTGGKTLNAPIVGMAATPTGGGYWEVASDGGIFSYGNAAFYGSTGGKTLDAPIVGIGTTPNGRGYWEVASDGGIFAYGDATYLGSMGGKPLNEPIVGITAGSYRASTSS